jgi:hypothetical protein
VASGTEEEMEEVGDTNILEVLLMEMVGLLISIFYEPSPG